MPFLFPVDEGGLRFILKEKCGPKRSNFAKGGASETITEGLMADYIVCCHKMD